MISAKAVSTVRLQYTTESQKSAAPIDGRLDTEDLARLMTGFRGQPIRITPTMRYVRCAADGAGTAYVFDEESGMVWILD